MAKTKEAETPALIMLDPKDLIPYANNANTHPPGQVAKLAASIRAFGFRQPIAYHQEFGIGAGHGRAEAAIKLGLAKVPCFDCSDMTEEQFRLFVLADNRIARDAVIDDEVLGAEMRALAATEADLELTGFDQDEIDEMFGGVAEDIEDKEPPDDAYKEQYAVIVTCRDEDEQEVVYSRLKDEGYNCKVVAT